MTAEDGVVDAIARGRVVSIVREKTAADARVEARRLIDGGARVIEVSLGTPDAMEVVRWMVDEFAGDGVHCGLGTVLTPEQVAAAADAGARFVVSPIAGTTLVTAARHCGLVGIFGAMTPRECYEAAAAGSDFVKLFPARIWGQEGLRDMLQALPDLRIVPTGGVTVDAAEAWLSAGAAALGLGGSLRSQRSPGALQAFYRRVAIPAGDVDGTGG